MMSDEDDRVRVSPVFTVLDADNCADHRKFPEVEASQKETWETTSPLVPAHVAHCGVFDEVAVPPETVHDAEERVVTDETAFVPTAIGFAVWS